MRFLPHMIALCLGVCGMNTYAAEMVTYRPLEVPVSRPDGGEFQTWDNTTKWSKTYCVDASSPKAADTNPGDEGSPFKTIARAAQVLRPGERVVVRPGVYRELVRPARGGEGQGSMIGYHADPSGPVVIKGADVAPARWRKAQGGLWELDLSELGLKDEVNPFLLENLPENSFEEMPWAQPLRGQSPYTQTRGMVFQDGAALSRVDTLEQVTRKVGSHWTDRQQKRLYIKPLKGVDPNSADIELTTRPCAFRPAARGLGFIEIRGFTAEMFGNCFPRPQEGAISTYGGHHFRIENNIVRYANGIGIDIGNGWYAPGFPPAERGAGKASRTIVRGNRVEHTGVCGIAGLPAIDAIIERNTLIDNTMYPISRMFESAAIKTHGNNGTLIRQNIISKNPDNGIWMDFDNRNSRCTQNIIFDCDKGIFLEASVREPFNMIDRNVVFRATNGIYEHDSWKQTFVHNLVVASKTGIRLNGTVTKRMVGDTPVSAGGHTVANNLILNTPEPIFERKVPGFPNNNITDNATKGASATLNPIRLTLSVEGLKSLEGFCKTTLVTHDLLDRPWPAKHLPGPLAAPGQYPLAPATRPVND